MAGRELTYFEPPVIRATGLEVTLKLPWSSKLLYCSSSIWTTSAPAQPCHAHTLVSSLVSSEQSLNKLTCVWLTLELWALLALLTMCSGGVG